MTQVFLAYSGSGSQTLTLSKDRPELVGLNILVSFYYIRQFEKNKHLIISPKATILDSGAFSAWKSKKDINIDALVEERIHKEMAY